MKKYVNIRIPVILALAFAAGIGLGYFLKYNKINLLYMWIAVPATAIPSVAVFLFKRSVKPVLVILFAAAVLISGFAVSFNKINNFQSADINTNAAYYVSGTVDEKTVYENYVYLVLDDVYIDGAPKNYKISVRFYGDDTNFDNGYKVYFDTTLSKNDVFVYGSFNLNAIENIKYTCSANTITTSYKFNVFAELRSHLRDTLYDNLSPSTAEVCYAMLTGNTGDMESDTLDSFRYGGIAHIFAVSGLHIGIIFGILNFICKRFHVNRWVAAAICLFTIFFYSGLCGFSSSSLRAAIMCTVLLLANRFLQKYDGLNSLSVAVIALLIINPFYLFHAGFQLSISATCGILTLSRQFEKMLSKIKLPKKLRSGISISLSAQLSVIPVMINTFGYVSGAGLLLNIIFIPVLSAFFAVLFVCTFACMIIAPIASFVLPTIVLPYELIASFVINAGFEKALLTGFGAGLFTPLFLTALMFLSDKINFGKYTRILGTVFSACILTIYVFAAAHSPMSGYDIIISGYYNGGEVLVKSRYSSVLIVTEDATTHPKKTLNKYYSSSPTAVIILGGENAVEAFADLGIDCKNLFLAMQLPLQPYPDTTVHYSRYFSVDGVHYTFENNYSISFKIDDVTVCVCAGGEIPYTNADLIISRYPSLTCESPNHVYFNNTDYKYNVKECGDIRFSVKNNVLLMK